jgi:hypothetical protein
MQVLNPISSVSDCLDKRMELIFVGEGVVRALPLLVGGLGVRLLVIKRTFSTRVLLVGLRIRFLSSTTLKKFVELELMRSKLGHSMRYFDYPVNSLAKALHWRFALT